MESKDYSKILAEKQEEFKKLIALSNENAWEFYSDKDNMLIHFKKNETTGLYYIRSEGTINAPLQKVVDALSNPDNTTKWDQTVEKVDLIETKDNYLIAYTLAKTPSFLVDKRDFVFMRSVVEESDGSVILAGTTIEHEKYPAQTSPVRAEIPVWGWKVTVDEKDKDKTRVVYAVLVDPKGSLPKLIINQLCTDQAGNVKSVRNFVEGVTVKKGWFK